MWTEEKLNEMLTTPSSQLIEDMKKIKGNITVLGAGGKMGPTLCVLTKRAAQMAGVEKRVIAVSRFSEQGVAEYLQENGVETIHADLLDARQLDALPETENVIFMAGKKFGTDGNEALTWAMNATLPTFVARKYQKSNIVVFSSGNIYPIIPLSHGGCVEEDPAAPIGDYAMSCLARERAFEYAAKAYGTNVFIYRLNFAVDLRYGVLFDVAKKVLNGTSISLSTPCFNFIWQGSANEIAIRGLLHAASPAVKMNVTGPETVSIRYVAQQFAAIFGKEAVFENEDGNNAYLNNSMKAMELFGYPSVSAATLIRWQAEYILDGCKTLDKPTHFEERKGSY